MSRLRPIMGYTWTILAVFIVLATFIGNDRLSRRLTWPGGDRLSMDNGWRRGRNNRTWSVPHDCSPSVFDGLLGRRSKGFVQINWETGRELPPVVEERIDLGKEKGISFLLHFDTHTGKATIEDFGGSVIGAKTTIDGKDWAYG